MVTDNLDEKDKDSVNEENQLNDTAPVELILNLSEVMHKSST